MKWKSNVKKKIEIITKVIVHCLEKVGKGEGISPKTAGRRTGAAKCSLLKIKRIDHSLI